MKTLENWRPLSHYKTLKNTDNVPGIYIWGFFDEYEKFMPYYVGKARNIGERLCSHLSNIKGGSYTVYPQNAIFNTEDDNFIYKPTDIASRIGFISNGLPDDVENHALQMIENFYFTYTEMSVTDFKVFGDDAEKTILNLFFKSGVLINTRIGTPNHEIEKGNLEFDGNRLKIIV